MWLVLIDTGRTLFQGPAVEFLAGSDGLAVAPERLADLPALADLLIMGGHRIEARDDHLVAYVVGDAQRAAAEVNRAAFDAGIVLVELHAERSSLEDRYLSMVAEVVR
jgi:ABC-2 type transport system ATP-binding protein